LVKFLETDQEFFIKIDTRIILITPTKQSLLTASLLIKNR